MGLIRQVDVVGIAALALDQDRILGARDGLADAELLKRRVHVVAGPCLMGLAAGTPTDNEPAGWRLPYGGPRWSRWRIVAQPAGSWQPLCCNAASVP